jgi:hypothetical protein
MILRICPRNNHGVLKRSYILKLAVYSIVQGLELVNYNYSILLIEMENGHNNCSVGKI